MPFCDGGMSVHTRNSARIVIAMTAAAVSVCVAGFFAGSTLRSMPAVAVLSSPTEMWHLDGAIFQNPVPTWQNGFLLSHQGNSNLVTKAFAFDRNGKKVFEAAINVPGAATVSVVALAASPEGLFVASGGLNSAPNTGWLAWLAPPNRIERLVMTAPFIAHELCFAPDGTLWAAGLENGPEIGPITRSYNVFRHYGRDGQLIDSYFPKENFGKSGSVATTLSHLVCSADRLGFYGQIPNEWIELSYTGQVIGRWAGIGTYPNVEVASLGITSAGVHITTQEKTAGGKTRSALYRLDKTTGSWIEAQTTSGKFEGHILGIDRDGFVMRNGGRVVWAKLE
jgi:hypothetical protein